MCGLGMISVLGFFVLDDDDLLGHIIGFTVGGKGDDGGGMIPIADALIGHAVPAGQDVPEDHILLILVVKGMGLQVVAIGEANGGWEDFYGFATRIPAWASATVILPLTFGIATAIRLWHNHSFVRRRRNEAQIFLDYFEGKDAQEIIFEMGKARARLQPCGDIIVPSDVIKKVVYFTESDLGIDDACKLYLDGYLFNRENRARRLPRA